MKVEIKSIITGDVIWEVFDVVDVKDGVCNTIAIINTNDTTLYKPVDNQVIVIINDVE
tara:strand:+ start:51 stop:224 length:174 start_codon:yes stop_codon:yes gene_type:complete